MTTAELTALQAEAWPNGMAWRRPEEPYLPAGYRKTPKLPIHVTPPSLERELRAARRRVA